MAASPSPLVIAVSGHRALHADDAARLLTQLCAEQALALQAQLGAARVRLRVPLPMPEAAYIASQEAPGSLAFRDSFLALLGRAQDVFEVPAALARYLGPALN